MNLSVKRRTQGISFAKCPQISCSKIMINIEFHHTIYSLFRKMNYYACVRSLGNKQQKKSSKTMQWHSGIIRSSPCFVRGEKKNNKIQSLEKTSQYERIFDLVSRKKQK